MSEDDADPGMALAVVTARTGLSADTLRYYEREGLLPPVARSPGGRRRYRQVDLDRLAFLLRLRATGMPIATMRRFAELRRHGEAGRAGRLAMLLEHRAEVRRRVGLLGENLRAIDRKIDRHRRILRQRGECTVPDASPAAFELLPLHHVQLAIPPGGEDACRAFWRDVLGMEELAKPPVLAARGGCWFRGGGLEVHLGAEDPFVPAKKAHPGLLVSGLRELAAVLESAGHPVTWDDDFPGHDRCYATDPFGNRLEFLEPSADPS
ncbi:MerR family transcriptional regulator [Blastococcus sp. TF02A_35]|uniref:MerR family transcriptional regulator n=1 Tax=Blastococcus sp. TF02A-35 TaxID=2559612 RepID=UPI0010732D62|nr:MerR family transcriptional regulator [Blastococcus sp. TF02A_35]TFV48968.1 MerR family transcriptional regulator [Blastococcus sp. TF02A_35]